MDSCKFPFVALLGEELMCVDPADGVQTLHRAIHHINDGQVFMMGERFKLNVRTDRFAMRDRLERYLIRVYFGSDAAPWDPTRDEQVFAQDPMQDALLFAESVRSEIAALSVRVAGRELLQPRQMNSQNYERHFMCDPIIDVLLSKRIDIGEPSTSGGIGENGGSVVATASDESVVRRVSTVAPVKIQEKGESGHKANEQSTRVPVSPFWTEKYCCVRENSMDLRGGVHAQQSLPPSLKAVANCVCGNSRLTGKPVVVVPELLHQQVIGEVSIPKPYPGEIKLTNGSSQVMVRDVVLPRSNCCNAKANVAVADSIASSSRVSQCSVLATSVSRSCRLGQEVVQVQVVLLGASLSAGLQKFKLPSWLVLNNQFEVSKLTSMSSITIDLSLVMLFCFKVCDGVRHDVVELTDCQESRDMPLKLSRKRVRFRQKAPIVCL